MNTHHASCSASALPAVASSDAVPGPRCATCGAVTSRLTYFKTRSSNRNGNAGRPYLKCMICNKFVTFTDCRGINNDAPRCVCGLLSRQQIAGRMGTRTPRGLHYVCSLGQCEFYQARTNAQGEQQVLAEHLIDLFAKLNVI
ncbi:uncharacterized protein K489DRAFT_169265 [Dissoconium aciculare CBS 342.82]|uniref:GRF-like zinc ribbon domain-containing protein n=1 Tax=Dissoconium aciculare CBS 342.82 TaxID=1314786 RepID=A0A6J3M771_9PEZI|nr:uncharacterized protein K489DRAFT_169265 [Dissoconium aciculare CBS 342.82]KAF1823916.1 hypothetical protein K489DRAFT_169265 [Dissoconium aciculare CBS 342.82]